MHNFRKVGAACCAKGIMGSLKVSFGFGGLVLRS